MPSVSIKNINIKTSSFIPSVAQNNLDAKYIPNFDATVLQQCNQKSGNPNYDFHLWVRKEFQ